jgi:hypothetical protein
MYYLNFCFTENNPPHEEKWKEFRERNRLRKMDVAFNTVNVTKEQLRNMRSEDFSVCYLNHLNQRHQNNIR